MIVYHKKQASSLLTTKYEHQANIIAAKLPQRKKAHNTATIKGKHRLGRLATEAASSAASGN